MATAEERAYAALVVETEAMRAHFGRELASLDSQLAGAQRERDVATGVLARELSRFERNARRSALAWSAERDGLVRARV